MEQPERRKMMAVRELGPGDGVEAAFLIASNRKLAEITTRRRGTRWRIRNEGRRKEMLTNDNGLGEERRRR